MARKRFIDPNFWSDTAMGKLSPVERLFFIGCFSNADDEGRLVGSPAYLRSVIFPYDDFTLEEIQNMRDRVARACRNFLVYQADGEEYIAFARWRDYQSPRYSRASRLPAPPEPAAAGGGDPPSGVAAAGPAGAAADRIPGTDPEEGADTGQETEVQIQPGPENCAASTQDCAKKAAILTQGCSKKDASLQLWDGDGDGDGDEDRDAAGDGGGGADRVGSGDEGIAPQAKPPPAATAAMNGVAKLFAAELGRPLSPLEAEEIRRMAEASGEDLAAEALRRAVSRGNVRLDYVAGILASWRKKGLATPEDVRLHEAAAARASPSSSKQEQPGKYADVYVT